MDILLGDIEDQRHVCDLADGDNTTKRLVRSSVFLNGVDEQGPKELIHRLGKDSSDEAISRPVVKRLSNRRSVRPDSESSIGILSIHMDW